MKKLLLSAFIVTTTIVQPTFPSLAKDCPTIAETIKEVTVKNSAATLRTKPKYSTDNKGPAINTNDKLTVIIPKPELGPDKENNTHCWYKVRPVKASAQEDYWIADIGISEFPFEVKDVSSQAQSSTQVSNQDKDGQNTNQDSENQSKGKEETQDVASSSWLILALAGISALSSLGAFIFSLLIFLSQQKEILIISDDIDEIKKNIQQLPNQLVAKISSQNNIQLDSYYKRAKAKFQGISEQIVELKNFNRASLSNPQIASIASDINYYSPSSTNNPAYLVDNKISSPNNEIITITKREIDEVVQKFNDQNRDYFYDPRFHPLNLTKISSQGGIGEDGRRIIQLEPFSDVNQALFLHIILDGENWLIPNITSTYIRTIMNNLEEYSEIFSIKFGSGKPTLIQPAKLKNIDSGLWEIAEIGEFEK